MKTFRKFGVLAVALAPLFSLANDSVWKDALLHIRGGRDVNNNGHWNSPTSWAADAVEIPDVRHEAGTSVPASRYIWSGATKAVYESEAAAIRHETLDVVSAAQNVILPNQPCLVFPAANWQEGGTTYHYHNALALFANSDNPITGEKYTILARVRMDGFTDPTTTKNVNTWFLTTQAPSSKEIRLGFRSADTSKGTGYLNVATGGTTNPEGANTNVSFKVGEWSEIAFVVDGKNIRVSCGRPGQLRRWGTIAASSDMTTMQPAVSQKFHLGCVSYFDQSKKVTGQYSDFRGAVHMLALWNRALTDEEVVEAFAGPNPFLLRIGEEGCSQDLFAGGTLVGEKTLDQTAANQRDWPSALGEGAIIRMPFSVDKYRAGLGGVLRLLPREGSGGGEFEASIDGAKMAVVAVRARAANGAKDPSFLFVKPKFLTEGDHVLTLKRTVGESEVKFDVIELGGSWRNGFIDNARSADSTTESNSGVSTPFDGADTWYPASQNPYDFVSYCGKKAGLDRQKRVYWRMPDGLAAKVSVTLACAGRTGQGGETSPHMMALNGSELGRWQYFSPKSGVQYNNVQSYALAAGALLDGVNEIHCSYPEWTTGMDSHITYDSFWCEITDCVSDKVPPGLAIFLR